MKKIKIDDLIARISKEELEELYLKNNMTQEALAEYFHEPISKIRKLIYFYELKKSSSDITRAGLEKGRQTKLEKYGDPYYSNREKAKQTCIEKYGVEFALQAKEVRDKSTKTRKASTEYVGYNNYEKYKETCIEKYGVEHPMQSDIFQNKSRQTCLDKYGVEFVLQDEDVRNKSKQTKLERYGDENWNNPESVDQKAKKEKEIKTKREKGNLNTSAPEDEIYDVLCINFNVVKRNYSSDEYPFLCDFYIESQNLYIECNFHWTHGGHWYTKDDSNLYKWQEKAKSSDFYRKAIEVWTVRDVKKRECAKNNELNYVVLWHKDDFYTWKSLGFPNGQDYIKEYTWLPNRKLDNTIIYPKLSYGRQIVTNIAKKAQFNEFFKREIALWENNEFKACGTVQSNLYNNRLKYINKTPLELTNLEILRGLNISKQINAYSTFNNSGFIYFLNKYNVVSIYDPCAGWGERLVTCAALDIDYLGIDINENVIKGHSDIINHYGLINQTTLLNDSSKYINNPIMYSTTFTCPPYYNTEIYTDKGAENLSYEKFLEWWFNTIMNSNTNLFAYQINQKYKNDMNNCVINCGYELIDEIDLDKEVSHMNRNKSEFESIQVFKRGV